MVKHNGVWGGGGWGVGFFFFKQKTAYEIGTGDWSSDVCLPISFARWAEPFQATVVLVAAVTLARAVYALLLNPYPLIEDEAHYWE